MTSTTDSFVPSPALASAPAVPGWLPHAARVVFSLPYIAFGLFHFAAGDQMAAMVPVPGGVFWVYLTGVAMIAAAVSIISGKLAKYAAPALALLLATYAFTLAAPGMAAEGQAGQMATTMFLKDISLAGGALLAWVDALRRG